MVKTLLRLFWLATILMLILLLGRIVWGFIARLAPAPVSTVAGTIAAQ